MFETLFTLWGYPLSLLEMLAFFFALACVCLEVFEIHWAWPLAIVSSLLYAWLFQAHRLYGETGLQLFFVVISLWGWWQWLHGHRAGSAAGGEQVSLQITPLAFGRWLPLILIWLLVWGSLGLGLEQLTDTDVPFFDAFVTAGSIVGTVLMARKLIAAWPVLLLSNLVATALFGVKGLYLTCLLYAVFAWLSLIGWRRWRQQWQSRHPLASGT